MKRKSNHKTKNWNKKWKRKYSPTNLSKTTKNTKSKIWKRGRRNLQKSDHFISPFPKTSSNNTCRKYNSGGRKCQSLSPNSLHLDMLIQTTKNSISQPGIRRKEKRKGNMKTKGMKNNCTRWRKRGTSWASIRSMWSKTTNLKRVRRWEGKWK